MRSMNIFPSQDRIDSEDFLRNIRTLYSKKVRVITSSAKKPNYQEASERTEKSDSTVIKSTESRKERDINEVSTQPNKGDRTVKKLTENTRISSTLRKDDQSQHSIGSSSTRHSQSATSCSVGSLFARKLFGIIGQLAIPGATPSGASSSTAVRRPLFEIDIPRVKQTAKKPPKEFRCQECDKVFTQKSNYTRHLGLVHEVDEFGNCLLYTSDAADE